MMKTVPIVFAFDNNLILPACVCISSLLMNAKEETFYDIFILHSSKVDLHKEQLDELPKYFNRCRIQYRVVDNTFDQAFEIRGITTPTYYRLLIPELVPEYDNIIYSDVDVIFRFDLSDIYFHTDLNDSYVAGVNALVPFIPDMKKYYLKLGNVNIDSIIYAGNIILNSKKINVLKDICKELSVQFIDMYANCGICGKIETGTGPYLTDGLHPNLAGRKKMAEYAVSCIGNHVKID